ncbi:hypothetical protein A3197_21625 [Candidatus Thiodiazotropha endoloripes]|nr:hypothetical protein A3197_21625 [Candidatus Thiodiazotropha endoloripes]
MACLGAEEMDWPFDQEKNVATVTTKQVMEENYPVLMVVHYEDDHSWAFTCGTTNKSEDLMLVSMEEATINDPSLREIADLPPGWLAVRTEVGGAWERSKSE